LAYSLSVFEKEKGQGKSSLSFENIFRWEIEQKFIENSFCKAQKSKRGPLRFYAVQFYLRKYLQ